MGKEITVFDSILIYLRIGRRIKPQGPFLLLWLSQTWIWSNQKYKVSPVKSDAVLQNLGKKQSLNSTKQKNGGLNETVFL